MPFSAIENKVLHKDGHLVILETSGVPYFDLEGKLQGIGCYRDITERKQTELQLLDSESKLKEQNLALEQKNIALKEILAQIEIEKNKIKDDI